MREDNSRPLIAGVEMGGTKCILTLASGPDAILDRRQHPTLDPATTLGAITDTLDEWRAARGFDAIGIGGFGPLDLSPDSADSGAITATPKPGWTGANPRAHLAARYDVPIALQTDVNAAALAEARWGGAQGCRSNAYITVGTGVGVGVVADGRPVMGMMHPELGHLRVGRAPGDDWAGQCPYHGDCVEGLASGPAIAARTGRRGEDLAEDDPCWRTVEHALVGLLHMIVLSYAPERVAIGGGVMASRATMIARLRDGLRRSLNGYGATARFTDEVDVRLAAPGLGDLAGPLGPVALGLAALETRSR